MHRVLLYHAKRTSFSHSKRTFAKHATSAKSKGKSKFFPAAETLLPCRRKTPCLKYVERFARRFGCCLIEVKGYDIKKVRIVAVEKRGKTRRNFSEVTNAFKNGMWFVVNVIFQLAGYCFRRKVLFFPKGLGMIQWAYEVRTAG